MAKIDLKFLDKFDSDITIKTVVCEQLKDIFISIQYQDEAFGIWLDKSTAIKFAKTVRTEINKIKEVGNE
tara:strand:+ start:87 stop:296 length:210 start_codon:yes stop_codon:yes gene_type:complete